MKTTGIRWFFYGVLLLGTGEMGFEIVFAVEVLRAEIKLLRSSAIVWIVFSTQIMLLRSCLG
ncbi:hypothetical protein QX215_01740 [Chryseobacterium gambrini]|nr:hypothetical protein [Chryseobacterium gambrini]